MTSRASEGFVEGFQASAGTPNATWILNTPRLASLRARRPRGQAPLTSRRALAPDARGRLARVRLLLVLVLAPASSSPSASRSLSLAAATRRRHRRSAVPELHACTLTPKRRVAHVARPCAAATAAQRQLLFSPPTTPLGFRGTIGPQTDGPPYYQLIPTHGPGAGEGKRSERDSAADPDPERCK